MHLCPSSASRLMIFYGAQHDDTHIFIMVAPVRSGSVMVRAWDGSSGSGFRFRRFLSRTGSSVSILFNFLFYREGQFRFLKNGSSSSGSFFGSVRGPSYYLGSTIQDKIITYRSLCFGESFSVTITGNFIA